MAESLDDGEFWLPPLFLSDDGDDNNKGEPKQSTMSTLPFGFGFIGGFSNRTSPVESMLSSSETESDDDDYIARAAHFRFQDDVKRVESKGCFLSGSPESTLCPVSNGCGCKQCSSHGSPNGPSRLSSPPATWDLLFAAQEELARMRLMEDSRRNHMNELLGRPIKPSTISAPMKHPGSDGPFYNPPFLYHHQIQAIQQKQQSLMKPRSSEVWGGQGKATVQYPQTHVVQPGARNGVRPLGLSPSAWPPLQGLPQRQNLSDMRPVFLPPSGVKRECAGTGVFLPRQIRSTPSMPPRKKPGCSPVLLPARVVHALNLNLDELGLQQPPLQAHANGDASLSLRNSIVAGQQRRYLRPQSPVMNSEIRLPQEWTY